MHRNSPCQPTEAASFLLRRLPANIWSYISTQKTTPPGCTKEAIGFSEERAAFKAQNALVVGVSRDTVQKHDKFISKHDLHIPLISDEEGRLCEAFGTWVEKNMYGKTYMGIERATFLISPEGKLLEIWRKVKVSGHVEEVLSRLQSLNS